MSWCNLQRGFYRKGEVSGASDESQLNSESINHDRQVVSGRFIILTSFGQRALDFSAAPNM